MKRTIFILLLIPFISQAQIDSLTDFRDSKVYRTVKIAGTEWMLDNLDYEAGNSVGLTAEQKAPYKHFNLNGRYYHYITIDSVCPVDWRLPDTDDWTHYFNFLVDGSSRKVRLEIVDVVDDNHYLSFMNYSKRIDLFEKGNPLNLNPTGRIEGGKFNIPDVYADYYTIDKRETFKGKSHIHIMNAWTTVHSHIHNMEPEKEEELRKFMVRCVRGGK